MPDPKIRLNWTVPVPVIAAIAAQAAALLIGATAWKTTVEKDIERHRLEYQSQLRLVEARVAVIERSVASNEKVVERVTRVEEQLGGLKEQSTRIETKLETALERRR